MATLLEKINASAAARLNLPPNRRPSEELLRYKNFLKVETHRLKILHRAGAGGRAICEARSVIMDVLLRYILQAARNLSALQPANRVLPLALVATGGYGRAELNPNSDIDIMFLHDGSMISHGKPVPELITLTNAILYTLWDIGVKVGSTVRSVDECVQIANDDMQSKTALIEARLISGNEALFDRFQKTVVAKCVSGHEDEYVQMRLQDQQGRRARFGNSPLMQEPHLKNGCGGLRDYQNLLWMAFFKYRTHSLSDLEDKDMISSAERRQLETAYDFLLRVRNELHYHVGRAVDVLGKNVQPTVATNLGYSERSPSKRLELFMHDVYTHSRNIDLITRTVERRLALVPQAKLLPSIRELFRSKPDEQVVDGFKLVDGEIYPLSRKVFRDHPYRLIRVFLYAQQRNLRLHPDTAQLVRQHLSLVNGVFLRDPHVQATFLEILDERGNVAPILRAMHEVDLLGKVVPEFGRLTCLVQHEFYHQYTADEHTLVCMEKLDQIWTTPTPPFSTYKELLQKVERPFVLYLALLLHDSGKAFHDRKHSESGPGLALKAAKRLGLDGATAHSLVLLVEQHLNMALISQRRDLDDPNIIRNFARAVQTVDHLDMLTLLTFADSMGTSDQLWNSFKDSLLRMLYAKTREVLTGATLIRAEEKQRELLADEVRRLMPRSFTEEELRGHFDALPPRYFLINNAKEIVADLALVHRFMHLQLSEREEALSPVATWHDEPDRGYTTVNVCTWDRAGLFSKITGSLSASGLNILGAEIMTRNDGIVLDTFFVTDAATSLLVKREEKSRFETLLNQVLTGHAVNLPVLIAKQTRHGPVYKSVEGERIPTRIRFDNDTSQTQTVIDVETEDHVGLLFALSHALAESDLNVSLAKILTEKGAAIDSFYVGDRWGHKIVHPDHQKYVEQKLRVAIQGLER